MRNEGGGWVGTGLGWDAGEAASDGMGWGGDVESRDGAVVGGVAIVGSWLRRLWAGLWVCRIYVFGRCTWRLS